MKEFPDLLNQSNSSEFNELYYERVKCYLRRDLYEHVLKIHSCEYDPTKIQTYFSLNDFEKKWISASQRLSTEGSNAEVMNRMIKEVIPELNEKGWKCELYFGGTGLFIFPEGKNPPKNFIDVDMF